MRGSVAKKIRKAVLPVSQSVNDADVREQKRATTVSLDPKPVKIITNVRTLKKSSQKFLAGKIKNIHRKLNSSDRGLFFPVLAADVARIIAKNVQKAAA
jgi:hypothetical protein